MDANLRERFRAAFYESVRVPERAAPLKEAALTGRLGAWTEALTVVAVEACRSIGWQTSAKSHKLDLLPVRRSEYLGMDVMAFADGEKRWRFPAAVMELENSADEDHIAYSLWKVLAVRADLPVVFCYRRRNDEAPALVKHLREEVIGAMGLAGRVKLEGQTVLVIGSRNESGTFPDGFFHWWELEPNTGRFERI
ncbi:MAG: hypothetical protein HYY24_07355 [Verrucomicrobia bacterium]|nr:hypothetical protein [Verrucomicrobiota bacterium]